MHIGLLQACGKNINYVHVWCPFRYRLRYLWGDFIAGLTIGLTVIPQGLAQSSGIANLRPEVLSLYYHIVSMF